MYLRKYTFVNEIRGNGIRVGGDDEGDRESTKCRGRTRE